MASSWSTAEGFSILAMIAARRPTRLRSSATSSGRWTKESAIQSTPEPQREGQVLAVLLGQRRNRDGDAGRAQALVVRQPVAGLDHGVDRSPWPRPVTRSRTLPSSISTGAPGFSAPRNSGWGTPTREASPRVSVSRSSRKGWPASIVDLAALEVAQPELGALQVGQYPQRPLDPGLRRAHGLEGGGVVLVGPVAHVQPEDVGADAGQARARSPAPGSRGRG